MAVIRAVTTAGGRKMQAIVRKGGYSLSRVFWRTREAEDWARRCEDAIASATPEKPFDRKKWLMATPEIVSADTPNPGWNIERALRHYGETITMKKKGFAQELSKIGVLRKSALGKIRLDRLTSDDVKTYVKQRETDGLSGSTIRKHVYLLSALYRDAAKEWKLPLKRPWQEDDFKLPKPAPPRERRFQDGHDGEAGEEERIRAALAAKAQGATTLDLMDLAVELSMRQSEVLGITAEQVKKVAGVTFIDQPDSKNGGRRHVPLSKLALEIVTRHRTGKKPEERLFPWKAADLRQRWKAALKSAGITGLRWHDLRHEALTRMHDDKGMNLKMIMQMSGHRTVRQLMDYTNPTDKEIAKKLG